MDFNGMLTERVKTVFVAAPKNYTGAALTEEYISMKLYSKVRWVILTGAWAGGTAAVTLKQATAVAGTSAKAITFTRMWTNDGATSTDTLTETAVTNSTFDLDVANAMYVVEVNTGDLDVANGFDCVAIAVASPGANDDLYSIVGECYASRYEYGLGGPSAIVD